MTQAVTYVEIDVPHCSLTYSTLPCRAQLGFDGGGSPNGVTFGGGGDNAYATRGAGLSGAADSKLATGSFSFRTSNDITTSQVLFAGLTSVGGTTVRFRIRILSGTLRIMANNSAGTTILDIRSSTLQINNWYHCLFSVDLANAANRHLYIDDVSDLNVTTYTNDTMDLTLADWSLGALGDGSSTWGAGEGDGAYADFWLLLGTYTDFSNATNRRKFIDANLRPVFLGTTGQVPTGSSPIVFFGNPWQAFYTNLGTGGGFTLQNSGDQDAEPLATGEIKCFNSLGTCQDLPDFTNSAETVRFGEDVGFGGVQTGIDAYPFIKSIDFQPAIISLEGDLGQRATIKIIFNDSKHPDIGVLHDHYASTRPYTAAETYDRGTFWGKFRARHTFLRETPLRLIRGVVGQSLAQMETRHFIIDSIDGPDPKGQFTIIAKDILKMADGDRALVPVPNTGSLSADITDADVSFDVVPAGIGAEYDPGPANFAIGGSEIVIATVSGDTFTITQRGAQSTEAQSHSAGDRVQMIHYRDDFPA